MGIIVNKIKPLKIRDIEIPYPILQGGMGVAISTDSLASAVSKYGGLGEIASVGIGEGIGEPDAKTNYVKSNIKALKKLIRKAKMNTSNPISVNLMMALTDWKDLAKTVSDENVEFLVTSTAIPLSLPDYVDHEKTRMIVKVSSDRAAYLTAKKWDAKYGFLPDAFIIEGPKSGGHQGFSFDELDQIEKYSLKDAVLKTKKLLIPLSKKYNLEIPVIAAGGIYSGKDMADLLNSGADGILMGSKFVCTDECDVSPNFKEAYINAKESDLVLIKSPVGLPARVIKNEFYKRIFEEEYLKKKSCTYHCLSTCSPLESRFCIADALVAAKRGDMENALILASSTTPMIDSVIPVRKLLDDLIDEANKYLK